MLTAICPYCLNGIDVLSDDCMKALKYKGKILCECNNESCGKDFIVRYIKEKPESIKREDDK